MLKILSPQNFIINSLSVQVKSRNWLFQDLDFPGILKKYNVEFPGAKQEITKIFRGNKEKITKNLASFPIGVI